jgi:hypothetical protein
VASAFPPPHLHNPLTLGLPDDGRGLVRVDFWQRRLIAAVVSVDLEEPPEVILAFVEAIQIAHRFEPSRSAGVRHSRPYYRAIVMVHCW